MKEKLEKAVAKIFENYENSEQMKDFQEEIVVNLLDKVNSYIKEEKMSENAAVGKAIDELGEITEIADNIGMQKRQETIGDYYFTKKPLDKLHAVGYCICGVLFLLGIIATAIFLIKFVDAHLPIRLETTWGTVGTMFAICGPFFIVASCGFVGLGLTQETRTNYPMQTKRALLFCLAVGLILGGLVFAVGNIYRGLALSTFVELSMGDIFQIKSIVFNDDPIISIFSALIILFGIAMFVYLCFTYEKRQKPWVAKLAKEQEKHYGEIYTERFGLICGAIWIAAITIFVSLSLTIGMLWSWVAIPGALVVQLLVMAMLTKGKTAE